MLRRFRLAAVSERHAKESASEAWPPRAALRIVALFALLLSLTFAAAPRADASAFIKAYGWGVSDGAGQFEICTSTCYGGINGGGAGQLNYPYGVTVAPSGVVYVADYKNNRIDEFSAAGAFIKAYGWGVADGMSQFETCTTTCQIGIAGGGAGQLNSAFGIVPFGISTDRSGDVYVANTDNNRIDEFSAAGTFIKAYGWGVSDGASQFETCTSTCQQGIPGGGAGQLDDPLGAATDSSGDVYVTDTANNRIDEFSPAGAFIKAYGWGVSDGASQFETCTSTCQAGIYPGSIAIGGGTGQVNRPVGIATGPSGDVYVGDSQNNRIDEFSAAGAFIKAYGWGVSDGASQFETCTSSCQNGIAGAGAGDLSYPAGVATDSSGDVDVADVGNKRIDEFSPAGAFIRAYGWGVSDGASQFETCPSSCRAGSPGGGAGQFYVPEGVATDSSGDVYVADYYNFRIDEFSAAALSTTPPVNTTATYIPPAPPAGGTKAPPGATRPDPTVKVLPPITKATATPTKATLGYRLSGKGTTAASGHKITSWVWKLGNKVVGRKETIDVKLPAYNTKYSYTLTVTQSGGETGSASVTVKQTRVKRITTKTITTQLTVSSDTLFAWNSFALTSQAKAELNAIRAAIKASKSVVISGYCDDTGDNDPVSVGNSYNVWLSTERALAVADFLYGNKVPTTTKLFGYGRTHFVATNATAAGRAENRRVTIQF